MRCEHVTCVLAGLVCCAHTRHSEHGVTSHHRIDWGCERSLFPQRRIGLQIRDGFKCLIAVAVPCTVSYKSKCTVLLCAPYAHAHPSVPSAESFEPQHVLAHGAEDRATHATAVAVHHLGCTLHSHLARLSSVAALPTFTQLRSKRRAFSGQASARLD